MDKRKAKLLADRARKRSADLGQAISNLDYAISFEESSAVLEGLIRGTEEIIRFSLVVESSAPLPLDPTFFLEESSPDLAIASARGLRKRFHRPFYVRIKTAADLVPSLLDPKKEEPSFLTTRRGFPLYFSPLDPRLGALHQLVVGATGAGKSFFTGLVLKRLLEAGAPISVLFIDHNRSFKRLCLKYGQYYLEPQNLDSISLSFTPLDRPGTLAGVELSDLLLSEKKEAAQRLLAQIEEYLRKRTSSHILYIVLDECWNFLRDEPVLVQRAYREYRKLRGAVVSLSHGLTDFLNTENGQSILQNAPLRILLRQGEDLLPLQSVLELNSVELKELRRLRQKKGVYAECLIKTPFSSQIGRLYPTEEEFSLLQTDNLRQSL